MRRKKSKENQNERLRKKEIIKERDWEIEKDIFFISSEFISHFLSPSIFFPPLWLDQLFFARQWNFFPLWNPFYRIYYFTKYPVKNFLWRNERHIFLHTQRSLSLKHKIYYFSILHFSVVDTPPFLPLLFFHSV